MRKVELRFKSEKKRMAQDTSRMQLALDDTNRRIDGHEQVRALHMYCPHFSNNKRVLTATLVG